MFSIQYSEPNRAAANDRYQGTAADFVAVFTPALQPKIHEHTLPSLASGITLARALPTIAVESSSETACSPAASSTAIRRSSPARHAPQAANVPPGSLLLDQVAIRRFAAMARQFIGSMRGDSPNFFALARIECMEASKMPPPGLGSDGLRSFEADRNAGLGESMSSLGAAAKASPRRCYEQSFFERHALSSARTAALAL